MHKIQEQLLKLSDSTDLSRVTLRELARIIGKEDISPAVLQHHFGQLAKKGLLFIDRKSKIQRKGESMQDLRFYNIPIVGAASCGEANELADENVEGYLKLSKTNLHGLSDKLIAVRAAGDSMNAANVTTPSGEKSPINDGDYVVVDYSQTSLDDNLGKYVLSIIGGMANIKKLAKRNFDIALMSESTNQKAYPPIIIHSDDDFLINGRVVAVVEG